MAAVFATLDEARDVASICTRCVLSEGRTNVVFGIGSEACDVMFVGEGPGAEEDRLGVPFVGRSGQLLDRLVAEPSAISVLIPRTEGQRRAAIDRRAPSLIVPERAIDAQSLIAYSDLVVSAGGTMNREAVALGVPVYTIFSGRMGAVDEGLIAAGRLLELGEPEALELVKRSSEPGPKDPRDAGPLVAGVIGAVE